VGALTRADVEKTVIDDEERKVGMKTGAGWVSLSGGKIDDMVEENHEKMERVVGEGMGGEKKEVGESDLVEGNGNQDEMNVGMDAMKDNEMATLGGKKAVGKVSRESLGDLEKEGEHPGSEEGTLKEVVGANFGKVENVESWD